MDTFQNKVREEKFSVTYLDPQEEDYLSQYRRLAPEDQFWMAWLVRNMEVLSKLLPVEHLSLQVLEGLFEEAKLREDHLLICLTSYALSRKRAAL